MLFPCITVKQGLLPTVSYDKPPDKIIKGSLEIKNSMDYNIGVDTICSAVSHGYSVTVSSKIFMYHIMEELYVEFLM